MKIIKEIEEIGGMTKAIQSGMPKMKIEESAAKKQAQIDSGKKSIVGVNKYKLEVEPPIEARILDNTKILEQQIKKLKDVKAKRDTAAVKRTLAALQDCAETKQGNLLEMAVHAARARATVGEICDALEKVYGRYTSESKLVSGAYSTSYAPEKQNDIEMVKKRVVDFEKKHGRRPRIYIAKMGQDGHDRGAKVVSSGLADLGFDVDVGPLFQTPEEAARDAVDNDVHIIGVSSLAAGHRTLVPQLIKELKKFDLHKIHVILGGVIPHVDYDELYKVGVECILGPGTSIVESANKLIDLLKNDTEL